MKKFISLVVVLSMILCTFAACGSKPASTPSAGGSSAAAPSTEKKTITLRIGSGHAETNPWVQAVEDFFIPEISKRVEENTNYSINWIKSWGGSVVSLGSELEGVQDGLLDIGCVILAFEASRLPLEAMAYSCPFACSDPAIAAKVMKAMLAEFPEYNEDFDKYNQKLLGMGISDQYGLFSTKQITSLEDLAGMKIGAAGLNLSWIEGSGGIGCQTSLNDTYQNLQTNVCGSTIQPTHSCVNLKIYEVAPYYLDTNFNVISPFNALTVNKDSWNKLPAEVQDILVAVGSEYIDYESEFIATVHAKDLEILKQNNCQIDVLSREGQAEWASKLADTVHNQMVILNDAGYDGSKILTRYYELLAENGQESVRAWDIG